MKFIIILLLFILVGCQENNIYSPVRVESKINLTDNSVGTGMVIKNDKSGVYILTAQHIISYSRGIKVYRIINDFNQSEEDNFDYYRDSEFIKIDSQIFAESSELDLVILKCSPSFNRILPPPVTFYSKIGKVQLPVFIYGVSGKYGKLVTEGVISDYKLIDNKIKFVSDCEISPGISGAGVFNEDNEIIGMAQRVYPNGFSISLSSWEILMWLKEINFEVRKR
jgi:S1-C subfamily serine protease